MMTRLRTIYLLASISLLTSTGCIVVGIGGCYTGPSVWTAGTTEKLPIDTANLNALVVRTHNGSITVDGQPAGTADAHVTVTKKAGGLTQADAEEALDAIDVYVESTGGGTQRIGWKWKGGRHATWRARVSFDIKAPANVGVTGQTHNGPIKINDVVGDVRITTHNGSVSVNSTVGRLYTKTHNGRISTTYVGADVTFVTHNGGIVADFEGCKALDGRITTHNGRVEVIVGEATSATLKCRTHNGGIKCIVPLNDSEITRRWLTGTIGSGEGNLEVTTHNGSIRIKKAG